MSTFSTPGKSDFEKLYFVTYFKNDTLHNFNFFTLSTLKSIKKNFASTINHGLFNCRSKFIEKLHILKNF